MDFFQLLHEGVPLGIDEAIPPCTVLFPPDPPADSVLPLQHCDSAWKSALDHVDLVDGLLEAEDSPRRGLCTAVGNLGSLFLLTDLRGSLSTTLSVG